MSAHALLSASGAKRWIACPPSARFEETLKDPPSSVDALLGTLAHAIAEARLAYELAQVDKRTCSARLRKLRADPLYGPSVDESLDGYIDYVLERIAQVRTRCVDPEIQLEMRLDYSQWAPEGFGTGDVVIVADGTIDIIDLKFGKGVPVFAEGNPQLRLYALGAYHELSMLYDITEVTMHIVQPRLDSIGSEAMTAQDLLAWADNIVIPAAKLAHAGKGEYASGDHCRWCKAKNLCRRYAFDKLELARHDFADPPTLTDDEIAEIIGKAEDLARWAKSVKAYAQEQALRHGRQWPGWKLVAGKSNRVIRDEKAAIAQLDLEGFGREQTCKLRGIGELEELVDRKKLPAVLGGLLIKPEGAPTLVPERDKRPALDRIAQAQNDFKEDI